MDFWDLTYRFLTEFLIGTVIIKLIIAHSMADLILKLLKWMLIRTKQQAILWIHYRDRAMNRGHALEHAVCIDGLCHFINK